MPEVKLHLLLLLLCLSPFLVKSQDGKVYSTDNRGAGFFGLRNLANLEDYILGVEGGWTNKKRDLTFFGSFDFRPYRKRVLLYQGNGLFYQFAEQRFFSGIGMEYLYRFKGDKKGVYVQGNLQYTWAYFGGTERKPPHSLIFTPGAGFFWRPASYGLIKLGYMYLDTQLHEVDKNRLVLTFIGLINRD